MIKPTRIYILVLIQYNLSWSALANFVEIANPDTIDVFKATDNYACSKDLLCHKINSYKVKVPRHYDCKNDGLPIKYKVNSPNSDKSVEAHGFIRTYVPNGVDGSISHKQLTTKKCRHIRRYFLIIFK